MRRDPLERYVCVILCHFTFTFHSVGREESYHFVGPCLKQAITGSSSSHPLQKNASSNLSEILSHESGELPIPHSQTPLFEELCVSLRSLIARDCTRPIISSPEPDEGTIESVDIKPSLKSGDYMETFYEIQARLNQISPSIWVLLLCSCEHVDLQPGLLRAL